MAERFTGSWRTRIGFLMLAGMVVAIPVLFAQLESKYPSTPAEMRAIRIMGWAAVPLFLASTLWIIAGFLETFTVYLVDNETFTRKTLFGTTVLPWQRITRLGVTGTQCSGFVLTDDTGKTVQIRPSFVHQPEALCQSVRERLAGLWERQRREFRTQTHIYYPTHPRAWFFLLTLPMLVCLVVMPLIEPGAYEGARASPGMISVMYLVFGLSVVPGLCVHDLTHKLTISPEAVSDTSFFRRRCIPLNRIESVTSRAVTDKSGSYEVTTVLGAGQRLVLSARMMDYLLLRDCLRERAGEEP